MSKREIVFDTETTGLDPFSGHRIIELGCVEMIDKSRTGKTFHAYLNPERDVPDEAFRVHGIATDFLKDKPLFAHVVEDFVAFVGDAQLVIHNAGFDMKFINWELENAGFAAIPMERATDTLMIARRKFPGSPNSLDALCKRFMIDLSSRTKHGALLDAELLAEVYVELSGGKQVAISFDRIAAKEEAEDDGEEAAVLVLPERQFQPLPEELAAHEAFIARLKKPIWEEA